MIIDFWVNMELLPKKKKEDCLVEFKAMWRFVRNCLNFFNVIATNY